jgi:lysozyme
MELAPALTIIKKFEGCLLHAYLDPVGIPTIGWGTTRYPDGRKVRMGDHISLEQAERYLHYEVLGFTHAVESLVKVPLTNNEFCALTSFCYNLGSNALEKSTLLKKLNKGVNKTEVADEFLKWINAGGHPLKGLLVRREAERNLFLTRDSSGETSLT